MRRDVSCNHSIRANHRVIFDLHARQNGGVVGNADAVAETSRRRVDLMDVVDVVTVGVDIGVVRDRYVVADVDAAAVIEQDVTMNDDVVSNREFVAK